MTAGSFDVESNPYRRGAARVSLHDVAAALASARHRRDSSWTWERPECRLTTGWLAVTRLRARVPDRERHLASRACTVEGRISVLLRALVGGYVAMRHRHDFEAAMTATKGEAICVRRCDARGATNCLHSGRQFVGAFVKLVDLQTREPENTQIKQWFRRARHNSARWHGLCTCMGTNHRSHP